MEINNVFTIFILNFWFENRPFSIFRAHFCAECRTTLACNRWIREKNTRISIFADFIVYIFHRLFFFSRTSNWILSSHWNDENSIVSIRRKNVWILAWVDIFRTCRWQCNYVMSNWVWENTLSSNLKLSQFSIRFIYFTIWRNYCIGFSTPLAPFNSGIIPVDVVITLIPNLCCVYVLFWRMVHLLFGPLHSISLKIK